MIFLLFCFFKNILALVFVFFLQCKFELSPLNSFFYLSGHFCTLRIARKKKRLELQKKTKKPKLTKKQNKTKIQLLERLLVRIHRMT